MANRRSFKSNVSFLEKISIGAIGTQQVFASLKKQGHTPLELERGSMSFKIWKNIKIKRIRVPDILCVACGHRVESRAKTTLTISMSHSFAEKERAWDYGLDDDDYVALVVCERSGEKPIDWQAGELVQYISVKELREAQRANQIVAIKPKGAEEGFEARIEWPAAIANYPGTVTRVDEEIIQYRRQVDNRAIPLRLVKTSEKLKIAPLVKEGDTIVQNQVLASVVPVLRSFPCSKSITPEYYIDKLSSRDLSTRYAAAKALALFDPKAITKSLLTKIEDTEEHIYVRLEAAASLARHDEAAGWSFIEQCLEGDYLQDTLEAVIVLGEIRTDKACRILCKVLQDNEQHAEIRSGAAWALGEQRNKLALDALVDSFSSVDEDIRIEASRALAKLASRFTPDIVGRFPKEAPQKRPGIAWALSKSKKFSLDDLLSALVDEDARHWVAYILGTQSEEEYIGEIEKLKKRDPEVYFAVTVLWKIMTSWVYDLEEYG